MVLATSPRVGDGANDRFLLRGGLGRPTLSLLPPLNPPFLDPPHLRHVSRRPALGSNPLVHLQHRHLPPLDPHAYRLRYRRSKPVALARRVGFRSGRRVWNDVITDSHTLPRTIHIDRCASTWFYRDDSSAGNESESFGTWRCLSRFLGGHGWVGQGVVLDRVVDEFDGAGGVLLVL